MIGRLNTGRVVFFVVTVAAHMSLYICLRKIAPAATTTPISDSPVTSGERILRCGDQPHNTVGGRDILEMNETIPSPETAVPAHPPQEQEETYIWDQKDHPFTRPAGSGFELMFRSIVNSLFREGIITGKGGLLDCGCQLGEHAIEYATLRGIQPVYAIDPGVQNLRQLKRAGRHLQNLNIIFRALSSELKTVKGDAMGFMGGHSSLNVSVFTLDSMFFRKRRATGLCSSGCRRRRTQHSHWRSADD